MGVVGIEHSCYSVKLGDLGVQLVVYTMCLKQYGSITCWLEYIDICAGDLHVAVI